MCTVHIMRENKFCFLKKRKSQCIVSGVMRVYVAQLYKHKWCFTFVLHENKYRMSSICSSFFTLTSACKLSFFYPQLHHQFFYQASHLSLEYSWLRLAKKKIPPCYTFGDILWDYRWRMEVPIIFSAKSKTDWKTDSPARPHEYSCLVHTLFFHPKTKLTG